MPSKSPAAPRMPKAGDTFAVPLGDAGYGAVRVIRTSEERERISALVAVTPYLAPQPPTLADPALRAVLRNNRGRFGGRPALCWYEGPVPPEFHHLGTIAPTAEELALDAQGTFGGRWSVAVAHDVLRERGVPVAAVAGSLKTPDTDRVTGTMDEAEFWSILALIDWDREAQKDVIAPVVRHLAGLPAPAIAGFHRQLCEKLFQLDRADIAHEIATRTIGSDAEISPDHFLDVRCAIVARGQHFYESVLSDPTMIRDEELELLATVALEAYRRKTGRDVVFLGAQLTETFSNRAGWSDE